MSLSKPLPVSAQCALAGACGLAFGIAFDKSRVFQPDAIVNQMLMQRFIMLKMFLAAVGTSAASLGIVSVVAPEKFAAARGKVSGGKKHLKVAALGAGLLGMGMASGFSFSHAIIDELARLKVLFEQARVPFPQ